MDQYSWLPPFDWTVAYENEHWWDEPRHNYVGEPWFVQMLEGGAEVAVTNSMTPAASTRSTKVCRRSTRTL